MFLGRTLSSHSTRLHPGVQIGTFEFNAGVTLRWTGIPGGVKIFLVASSYGSWMVGWLDRFESRLNLSAFGSSAADVNERRSLKWYLFLSVSSISLLSNLHLMPLLTIFYSVLEAFAADINEQRSLKWWLVPKCIKYISLLFDLHLMPLLTTFYLC